MVTLPLLDYTSSQRQKTYQNVNFLGPRLSRWLVGDRRMLCYEKVGELGNQKLADVDRNFDM